MSFLKINHSLGLAILFGTALITTTQAATPSWWTGQGFLNGQSPDDFSIVNQGQVKNITKGFIAELNLRYAAQGGAGTALSGLFNSWTAPVPPTVDDYAVVNIGQLKQVTKLVYDRLFAIGQLYVPSNQPHYYPWTAITTDDDDYALANIGQLKQVFNFGLENQTDRDGDGLPDLTELLFTKTNPESADSDTDGIPDGREDADGDGIINWQDYLVNTDGDDFSDYEEGVASTDLTDPSPIITLAAPSGAVLVR